LKRLQEKVLKRHLETKDRKLLMLFFVKTQWNETLNIKLMEKNSQYTFIYM
jgi:hypothetical protein